MFVKITFANFYGGEFNKDIVEAFFIFFDLVMREFNTFDPDVRVFPSVTELRVLEQIVFFRVVFDKEIILRSVLLQNATV